MIEISGTNSENQAFTPLEANLGRNCLYWSLGRQIGCGFPKAELVGRKSCEGMIDDVCLFIKDGREPISLTRDQQIELRIRVPGVDNNSHLPPGEPM